MEHTAVRFRRALQLDWESEGLIEQLGSAIGQDDRQVKGDLERFKELVESHGAKTGAKRGGAWRGEVEHGTHDR